MTCDLILIGFGHVGRRFAAVLHERRGILAREHSVDARVSARRGDVAMRSRAADCDGRLVVVETTTLDIARGEAAVSHVRTARSLGAHVVTANKGPVAFHIVRSPARRSGPVGASCSRAR